MNMNEKKHKWGKSLIMIILAALPAMFPFGGRDYYLFPYIPPFIDTNSDPGYVAWAILIAFTWITCVWCVYGYLFGLWFGKSKVGFLICNLPVLVNAISEIVYYGCLGYSSADHPTVAYWIGSHIDKMNPLIHIFAIGPVIVTIAISVLYYFTLFGLTYRAGLKKHYC